MSTTFETQPLTTTESAQTDVTANIGERLQAETTSVRLHFRWPGVRKTLGPQHKQQAADTFAADTDSVSVSKKLLDTRHPAFRAATAIRSRIVGHWKAHTLPYIEPGVRLLRRDAIEDFDRNMADLRVELRIAVADLDRHYDELVERARECLGNLFDEGDYAVKLSELFSFEWDYPSSAPPSYLLSISPELYREQCTRVRDRFDEAVQLAERAFADELAQLVTHLTERLAGDDDGTAKVFRDTAVTNLLEFFDRFQRLNIRSDEQLDHLVEDARRIVSGIQPQDLRDRGDLRQRVARELTRVEASLDGWLTERPRRRILRRSR
jgi:hypothetical protein